MPIGKYINCIRIEDSKQQIAMSVSRNDFHGLWPIGMLHFNNDGEALAIRAQPEASAVALVETDDVERVLADIDADKGDGTGLGDFALRHGRAPW